MGLFSKPLTLSRRALSCWVSVNSPQAAHADSPCRLHWIGDKVREAWGAEVDDIRTRAAVASPATPPRGYSKKDPAAGVEEL